MAIRIPSYERHVQLDSGAQTIPRITGGGELGKGLSSAGAALISLGAHLQKKNEQFDTTQMHQRLLRAHQEAQLVVDEETRNYDPFKDTPGTMHNKIMARVGAIYQGVVAQTPDHLKRDVTEAAATGANHFSTTSANTESQKIAGAAEKDLNQLVAAYKEAAKNDPESARDAVVGMRNAVNKMTGSFSAGQRAVMSRGYEDQIANAAVEGFQAQKKFDAGKVFAKDYAAQRELQYGNGRTVPPGPGGTAGGGPAPAGAGKSAVDPSKYETKLDPAEEKQFQAWKAQNAPNDSGHDYDLRGAFKAGVTPDAETGHFPDTFKKPNHPTFSDQSQYAPDRPDLAGRWDGDKYIPPNAPQPAPAPAEQPAGQPAPAPTTGGGINQGRVSAIDRSPVGAIIDKAARDAGLDPAVAKAIVSIESSGRPGAITGRYKGLFQMDDAEFKRYGPTGGNILDATDNAIAGTRLLAARSANFEKTNGRPPTATELYMMHQQGEAGAANHAANPDAPAYQNMLSTGEGRQKGIGWAKKAIWGNIPDSEKAKYGSVENVTSRDFVAMWDRKVTGGQGAAPTTAVAQAGTVTPGQAAVVDEAGNKIVVDPATGKMIRQADLGQPTVVASAGPIVGGMVPAGEPGQELPQATVPLPAARPVAQTAQNAQTDSNSWLTSKIQQIDASRMKAESIQGAMNRRLNTDLKSDIDSRRDGGVPLTLSPDLQRYYGTKELSYEFVANHLGEGKAIEWEMEKEQAERDNGGVAHMKEMSAAQIRDRVQSLEPVFGSPDYTKQVKTYDHASKMEQQILKQRDADPAAAADKMTDVKAAYDAYIKDPTPETAQNLTAKRMAAQEYLGIDDAIQTPITNAEASKLVRPFKGKGNLTPGDTAAVIVDHLYKTVGGDENLLNRALATALRQGGIGETNADQLSAQMTKAQKAAAAAITPVTAPTAPPPPKSFWPTNQPFPQVEPYAAMGEGVMPLVYGSAQDQFDTQGDPERPPGMAPVVKGDRVRELLKDPQGQMDQFDKDHGPGSANYFVQKQKELSLTPVGADPFASGQSSPLEGLTAEDLVPKDNPDDGTDTTTGGL